MKPILYLLFILCFAASCKKEPESASEMKLNNAIAHSDTTVMLMSISESVPENKQPVELMFSIYSKEFFPELLSLKSSVQQTEDEITIQITSVESTGKCPTEHLSVRPLLNYNCPAYGMVAVNNLKRGIYNFKVLALKKQIATGTLTLKDQEALIHLNQNSKVEVFTENIPVVPDSCIFGIYASTAQSGNQFSAFLSAMKEIGCHKIELKPGNYRDFEVKPNGEFTTANFFVLKTRNNLVEIQALMRAFIQKQDEIYGFIFEDSNRNYYNIKKDQ